MLPPHKLLLLLCLVAFSCKKTDDSNTDPNNVPTPGTGQTTLGKGQPGVVGMAGVTAWDNVPAAEKARLKGWNTLFLHQSVGQDLEEGCKANGFGFDYYGPNDKTDGAASGKGLKGGIFVDVGGIPNGNPNEKIRVFRENVVRNKDLIQIAVFKFGYADIKNDNAEAVKTAYKGMVDALRAQVPGLRLVHLTPPLVFDVSADGGNAAKANVGQWMKDTFAATDVVFDLQALETNGGTCQLNNVPRICTENRNTAADPSDVNGIDASDGQGHLGKKAGQRISKALLYAIYQAGR
jgi:hypothetical protein